MPHFRYLLLLLIACGPNTMKVMTMNLAAGAGSSYNNLDNWRNQGTILSAENPSFACFQEVDFKSNRSNRHYNAGIVVYSDEHSFRPEMEIAERRANGVYYTGVYNQSIYFGPTTDFDDGKYGNAIYIMDPSYANHMSTLKMDDHGLEEPRNALIVGINAVTIICTHLSVYGRTPKDLRVEQIRKINDCVDGYAGKIILMGDFNASVEEIRATLTPNLKHIAGDGIDQIWSNMDGFGREIDSQNTSDHDTYVVAEF